MVGKNKEKKKIGWDDWCLFYIFWSEMGRSTSITLERGLTYIRQSGMRCMYSIDGKVHEPLVNWLGGAQKYSRRGGFFFVCGGALSVGCLGRNPKPNTERKKVTTNTFKASSYKKIFSSLNFIRTRKISWRKLHWNIHHIEDITIWTMIGVFFWRKSIARRKRAMYLQQSFMESFNQYGRVQ